MGMDLPNEEQWIVGLPGRTPRELLLALLVRSRAHGLSIEVELPGNEEPFFIDLYCDDELDGDTYRLLIDAEVWGGSPEEAARVTEATIEELAGEAEAAVAAAERLDVRDAGEIEFRPVPEDEVRWSLVCPDWLAPDGASTPGGFRPYLRSTGEPWPDDATLGRFETVAVVPDGGRFVLYGVPAAPEAPAGEPGA